jgi:hypothetical protein
MMALVFSSISITDSELIDGETVIEGWILVTNLDIRLVITTINAKNTKTNPIPNMVKVIASLSRLLSILKS